jgi:TrmH family RNA methyltransferase
MEILIGVKNIVSVILVEPENPGNIGAVARIMKNFGFYDLRVVRPCEINEIAYARATHAKEILDNIKIFDSFEKAIKDLDMLIATTGKIRKVSKHVIEPWKIPKYENIGLVFGRESIGLLNEEIERCDIVVSVPTSEYKILNLSHAVGIILYEISKSRREFKNNINFEGLNRLFEKYISKDPDFKILKSLIIRGEPNQKELNLILGLLKKYINVKN